MGVFEPPPHPTVVVDQVSRHFRVVVNRRAKGLKERLADALSPRPTVTVSALCDVSFVAHSGESIGIVGANGSGKSTLLRIIAGLDVPSTGLVSATSQPMLLGVSAALQQDLSGLDNAKLGLLAIGMRPERVEETIPRVLELAGIGPAIERPMHTYSAGMGARLRFAIAAAAEPEILLLDEVLSTGDAASVERAERRMNEIRARAGTVFLVSHAAKTIQETCSRALWLHEGVLIQDGPAEETAESYRWWAWNSAKGENEVAARLLDEAIAKRKGVAKSANEVEDARS